MPPPVVRMPLLRQVAAALALAAAAGSAERKPTRGHSRGGASGSGGAPPRSILFVVGDDVGYNDLGAFNDGKTITPTIDGLIRSGILLSDCASAPLPRPPNHCQPPATHHPHTIDSPRPRHDHCRQHV